MNNKTFLKFFSAIVAFVLFSSINGFKVYAEGTKNNKIQNEISYIESVLPSFLYGHDVISNDIYISESFNTYNIDTMKRSEADTYVIFDAENIIGLLTVDYIGDKFFSSFEYGSFETLQSIYERNSEMAFVSYNEKLYIINNSIINPIDDEYAEVEFTIPNLESEKIIKKSKIENNRNTNSGYYYMKNISVPIVANALSPAGYGLCWAASIASKYDYISGNNLIAMDIYDALVDVYGGIPVGTNLWESRAFSYLNMNASYLSRMMDCSEILSNIQAYNPIYIGLARTGGAHAVLLCGITFLLDDSGIYRIMDPNRSVYVDIAVSEDTMNGDDQLTYVTSYGYTYTSWFDSWY